MIVPYVLYFAVCMYTPLNHTPNSQQCVMAAPRLEFPTVEQCERAIESARLRFSTNKGQTVLMQETPLPHMKGGRLYFIAKCETSKQEGFLQCVDCKL